jgi:hypothetical protein
MALKVATAAALLPSLPEDHDRLTGKVHPQASSLFG